MTGYSVGILLALMSLPSIWDYAFYISDDWRTRLNSYVVVVLLGCVVLLGYVFITARDRATRTQIWAIAWGSGIGMLYNITMVLLPASAIDPDTNSLLDSGAMLMALATPR